MRAIGKKGQGQSLLGDLTFSSIIERHELVVPKSIPIISFPAAFALKGLTKLPHFELTLAAHVDCKLWPSAEKVGLQTISKSKKTSKENKQYRLWCYPRNPQCAVLAALTE